MNKRCPDCGREVPVSDEVCPNCGYNFAENADENFPKDIGILGIQPSKPEKEGTQPAAKASEPKRASSETEPEIKAVAPEKPVKTQPSMVKPKEAKPTAAPAKSSSVKQKAKPLVKSKSAPQNPPKPLVKPVTEKSRGQKHTLSQPHHHWLHLSLGLILAVIVVFAVFFLVGGYYYSKDQQIDQLAQSLIKPQAVDPDHFISSESKAKVTAASLRPLQKYYRQHPAALNNLQAALKQKQPSGKLRLVQTGENLLFFPKYALQLPVYQLTVLTNRAKTNLAVNGQISGEMTAKKGKDYQLVLSHLLPGSYRLTAQRGQRIKSKTINLWSAQTVLLLPKKTAKKIDRKTLRAIAALLEQAFAAPQPQDFVRGANNAAYQTLNGMNHSWRRHNYRVLLKVKKAVAGRQQLYRVNYQVAYQFKKGQVKQQVMLYRNGLLVKEKGRFKVQSLGAARLMREQ